MNGSFDIPVYIDGEEVVERPVFTNDVHFVTYITQLTEGRDLALVVAHPHTEEDDVLGAYIGDEKHLPACPYGCDEKSKAKDS